MTQASDDSGGDARSRPNLPGYVIERELGRGGMGVVYLAWHLALGRHVAIKMMLAGAHAATEGVGRFDTEIRAVARLHHPNIVQIHDVARHEGFPYCALEYLGGGSLAHRLDGKPVSGRQAAELVVVLARAVQAAHEAGIVHRDLKPGNVLFSGDPPTRTGDRDLTAAPWRAKDAKITDFGVAKRLDDDGGMTATDSVIGTPSYMAPEQASGHSRSVGVGADVYSLGVILYELLTGRPPFTGSTALEILPRVLHVEPVPPSRLASVARDLETICLKCLSKDAGRRYAGAAQLADDLDRFLRGQSISARPTGKVEKVARWCRRNPAVAGLVAGLAAVAVLAFVGITWQWRLAVAATADKEFEAHKAHEERRAREEEAKRADAARRVADEERRKAETQLHVADAERRKAEANLAAGRISQAMLLWERHDVPKARELLAACPVEQRGWEWHYLHRLCRSHLATAPASEWASGVAVSPDGKMAVVAQGLPVDGNPVALTAYRLPTLTPHGTPLTGLVYPLRHFRFAADGRLAVVDGRFAALVLAPNSLAVEWRQPLPPGVKGGWLSPDCRRLVRERADHALQLWDTRTNKPGPILPGHTRPVGCVAFSLAGDLMVSADDAGDVRGWDLATGKERFRLAGAGRSVALSPDGRWLAANRSDAELRVFRVGEAKPVWEEDNRHFMRALTGTPVFSPDGRWLAMNSVHSDPRVWVTATGRGGHFLRGHEGFASRTTELAFSPDSRWLLTTGRDRTVRLWEPDSGSEVRVYRGHSAGVLGGAFAPDGRQLVTVSGGPNPGDNRVIGWDLTRDQQVSRESAFTRYWTQTVYQSLLAFEPSGRLLVGYSPFGVAAWDSAGVRREEWRIPISQDTWWEWHGMDASADGRFVVGRTRSDRGIFRRNLKTGETKDWTAEEPIRTVAASPNGRLVAVATRSGKIALWDAEAGKVVSKHEVGPVVRLKFAPDGRRLAIAGRGVAWLDLETGTLHKLDASGVVGGLAFQPNGPWLVCSVGSPGEIRVYDTSNDQLVRRWTEPRILGDVAFHPRGDRVAVASREGFVTLYDPRTGREVLTLKGLTGRGLDLAFPPRVAFSPDGRRLAANDYQTGLWVWEAEAPGADGDAVATEHRRRAEGASFDFHHRAAQLAQEMDQASVSRFHIEQLRRLEPPSGRSRLDRACLLARAEDWAGSARDFRLWLEGRPESTWLRDWPEQTEQYALMLLLSGDEAGYRARCRRLDRPAEGSVGDALGRMSLWAENVLPSTRLEVLARHRKGGPNDAQNRLFLGLTLLRGAKHAEALTSLEEVARMAKGNVFVESTAHLGLALLHHRCGRPELAAHHDREAGRLGDAPRLRHITNPHLEEWLAHRVLEKEVRRTLPQPGKGK